MMEGETSPPSLLQEADLIALMEKHGIGEMKASVKIFCYCHFLYCFFSLCFLCKHSVM